MTDPVIFGRKCPPPPARTPARPEPLNPQLEAFAASIRDAKPSDADEFARWRRDQAPRTLLMILVRFALLAPGLVCFIVQAPLWVSLSLELAGLAANAWLRRERRRQASEIAGWAPD